MEDHVKSVIVEQAAYWFVINRDAHRSESQAREFVEWLKASPLHVEAYLALAATARDVAAVVADPTLDVDALIAESNAHSGRSNVQPLSGSSRWMNVPAKIEGQGRVRLRWIAALAAAAVFGFVFTASWLWDGEWMGLPKTYRTAHGEQRTWPLPDGSVVQLNSESEVTVRYSHGERMVSLDRGQALFQVVHEAARRFRVVAGDTEIVAVGTQFDVYRRQQETRVTVVEGKVAVFSGEALADAPASAIPEGALRVVAGQQARIGAAGLLPAPETVNLHDTEAWSRRQIAFDHRALGEVVAEFNRYGHIPIQIDDPRLRSLPVSGVLNAYDLDSFEAFLRTLDGMTVEVTGKRVRVVPIAPHPTSAPIQAER